MFPAVWRIPADEDSVEAAGNCGLGHESDCSGKVTHHETLIMKK